MSLSKEAAKHALQTFLEHHGKNQGESIKAMSDLARKGGEAVHRFATEAAPVVAKHRGSLLEALKKGTDAAHAHITAATPAAEAAAKSIGSAGGSLRKLWGAVKGK